jgi:hypothetical protein
LACREPVAALIVRSPWPRAVATTTRTSGGGGGGGGDNAQEGSPATKAEWGATFNSPPSRTSSIPALSYTVAGIQELHATHLSLLTYKRVSGQEVPR